MLKVSQLPKLIVFDLDYTLWPFWVDTHVQPPFNKTSGSNIVDSCGKKVKVYPGVHEMLTELEKYPDIKLGVASRTGEIAGANSLLDLLNWRKYFQYFEIYPGSKVCHFKAFHKKSGIPLSEMLFFDDESRNTVEVERVLGVTCILVDDGMTIDVLNKGLEHFQNNISKCN